MRGSARRGPPGFPLLRGQGHPHRHRHQPAASCPGRKTRHFQSLENTVAVLELRVPPPSSPATPGAARLRAPPPPAAPTRSEEPKRRVSSDSHSPAQFPSSPLSQRAPTRYSNVCSGAETSTPAAGHQIPGAGFLPPLREPGAS